MSRMADQLGRVLGGRYRLLAPIGTGASAHVFLGEDVVLRRRVAVKVLHPALAEDEAFLRRFRAEARSAAALNHRNVMGVHDWGEEEDGPYLVLEYLGGGSLRGLLDRGHLLSVAQAARIGAEAASALAFAHSHGFVHRDIKPANLLFDEQANLRVADFGLARALAEAAWTEPAGAVAGTARYASPEQARGRSLDGRSDVYSLALVLVEAVTGRVPFSADTTIATLMARVDTPLWAPDELGPLKPIVDGAGRPEPDDRPDASQMASDLEAVATELPRPEPLALAGPTFDVDRLADVSDPTDLGVRDTPVVVNRPGPSAPFDLLSDAAARRRRPRWPWLVLLALLLVAGAAVAAWAVDRARVPSHPVPSVVTMTEDEARTALAAGEFEVRVTRRFVDGTAKGSVVEQTPARGTAKEGSRVTLVVSDGPTPTPVPDLANLPQDQAVAKLQAAGFPVAQPVATRFDEVVAKGSVIEWSARGQTIPKGTPISLTVSNGPAPRPVPDVKGKSFEEAKTILNGAGFAAARADVFHDTVPAGQVISTAPAPGTPAARDASVRVNVSKGPDLVTVPNVAGRSAVEAEQALNGAGLSVSGVSGPPTGTVFATDPPAGRKVKRGSGVVIATRK